MRGGFYGRLSLIACLSSCLIVMFTLRFRSHVIYTNHRSSKYPSQECSSLSKWAGFPIKIVLKITGGCLTLTMAVGFVADHVRRQVSLEV
ncbi:hypothetical protein V8E51_002404 [Hyaloscypha variabilis]